MRFHWNTSFYSRGMHFELSFANCQPFCSGLNDMGVILNTPISNAVFLYEIEPPRIRTTPNHSLSQMCGEVRGPNWIGTYHAPAKPSPSNTTTVPFVWTAPKLSNTLSTKPILSLWSCSEAFVALLPNSLLFEKKYPAIKSEKIPVTRFSVILW